VTAELLALYLLLDRTRGGDGGPIARGGDPDKPRGLQ
jgi:hypothetical protein